jgi:hypothetical protein
LRKWLSSALTERLQPWPAWFCFVIVFFTDSAMISGGFSPLFSPINWKRHFACCGDGCYNPKFGKLPKCLYFYRCAKENISFILLIYNDLCYLGKPLPKPEKSLIAHPQISSEESRLEDF